MEVTLEKQLNGSFYPATPTDAEKLQRVKVGEGIVVNYRKPRNYEFHKKYFALLNYAFDIWEPEDGPEKNFEHFRDEVVVMSGHYNLAPQMNGEVRAIPKSISFANMDETEFQDLYEKSVKFLMRHVLKNYTREDVDRVLCNIAEFA